MHRLIGILFLGVGIILGAIGAIPWVYLATRTPRRYHYNYVADSAGANSYGAIGLGILLVLMGVCILYRNHRHK